MGGILIRKISYVNIFYGYNNYIYMKNIANFGYVRFH